MIAYIKMVRSEADRKVHRRGAQLMDTALWHPVGRPTYPILAENKAWREGHGVTVKNYVELQLAWLGTR